MVELVLKGMGIKVEIYVCVFCCIKMDVFIFSVLNIEFIILIVYIISLDIGMFNICDWNIYINLML